MQEKIDIAFGFDAKFAPHVTAVISSVARLAKGGNFRFLMLQPGLDAGLRAKVESVAPTAQFIWIRIGEDDVPPFADKEHFTRSTLFRLGLEKLAPHDCERVLYLDADLTILRDIRELWHSDLGDYPIGAIADAGIALDPVRYFDPRDFARKWQLPERKDYFNAGVLLIDLKRVRAEKLFSKAIEFLAQHGPDLPYNDQDALNWAAWGRWKPLDVAWNVQKELVLAALFPEQSKKERISICNPAIVHYTGAEKPWIPGSYHPWAWLYWESLDHTPFGNEVAREYGMTFGRRLRLLARWIRRHPKRLAGWNARIKRQAAPLPGADDDLDVSLAA